jgi:hypothetical protein
MSTENQTLAQTNEGGQSVEDRILGKLGLPGPEIQVDPTNETPVEEPDDGFAELEWEGQSVKVPKGIKEALLRNDDYTRKTQELAEQRRSVEQLREVMQTRQMEAAFSESVSAEQREIGVIDAYLEQAKRLDWSQMSTEQILRQRVELDSIRDRRKDLESAISGKRAKFTTELQAKLTEIRGKSRELASKSIPSFSEETEKTVREYAKSEGLTDPEIDNVLLDHRSFKVLWKASQFDKVKAATGKAQEAAAKVDRVLRPGAAGERMPAKTAANLNFQKAMKAAGNDSGAKARVIEQRLMGVFSKGQ